MVDWSHYLRSAAFKMNGHNNIERNWKPISKVSLGMDKFLVSSRCPRCLQIQHTRGEMGWEWFVLWQSFKFMFPILNFLVSWKNIVPSKPWSWFEGWATIYYINLTEFEFVMIWYYSVYLPLYSFHSTSLLFMLSQNSILRSNSPALKTITNQVLSFSTGHSNYWHKLSPTKDVISEDQIISNKM